MSVHNKHEEDDGFWNFALINKRLAEIFFDSYNKKRCIFGYAYIQRDKYKTKKEQKWIEQDIKHFDLAYREGRFRNKITGETLRLCQKKMYKFNLRDCVPWEDVRKEFVLDKKA